MSLDQNPRAQACKGEEKVRLPCEQKESCNIGQSVIASAVNWGTIVEPFFSCLQGDTQFGSQMERISK